MKEHEITNIIIVCPEWGEDKSHNGGSYYQPAINFDFMGHHWLIDDGSCGDFGTRVWVERDGVPVATYGTMLHESEQWSDLSQERQEDVAAIAAVYETFRYSIPTKETIDQWLEPDSVIYFGKYPQTAEGTDRTPIEWLVLDYDARSNRVLLLSRYGLDVKRYNKDYTSITWEKCTLRRWLNWEFLNKAFTAKEQKGILMTRVDNSRSHGYSGWNTSGGKDTEDKIFLLSYGEVNKYFGAALNGLYGDVGNMKWRVTPTAYAKAQGAHTDDNYKTADGDEAGWWWLRSPGYYQTDAALVGDDGSLYCASVKYDSSCVRPALWIDLRSGIF